MLPKRLPLRTFREPPRKGGNHFAPGWNFRTDGPGHMGKALTNGDDNDTWDIRTMHFYKPFTNFKSFVTQPHSFAQQFSFPLLFKIGKRIYSSYLPDIDQTTYPKFLLPLRQRHMRDLGRTSANDVLMILILNRFSACLNALQFLRRKKMGHLFFDFHSYC